MNFLIFHGCTLHKAIKHKKVNEKAPKKLLITVNSCDDIRVSVQKLDELVQTPKAAPTTGENKPGQFA
jgi:hypothetical protein